MKKEEVPQDNGALNKLTRELCYVVDKDGNYVTELSTGWDVKKVALEATWNEIEERVSKIREQVLKGEASPIHYFMGLRLMDLEILSAYTGLWKWRIRRHLKPGVFKKLDGTVLQKYAKAFNVSVQNLKDLKDE